MEEVVSLIEFSKQNTIVVLLIVVWSIGTVITAMLAVLKYRDTLKINKKNEKKAEDRDKQSFDASELQKYKEAFRALRREIDSVRYLMAASQNPKWTKDSEGRYLDVNDAFLIKRAFRLGLTKDQIIRKTNKEVYSDYPDLIKLLDDAQERAKLSPHSTSVTYDVVFPFDPHNKVVVKEIIASHHVGPGGFKEVLIHGVEYDAELFKES